MKQVKVALVAVVVGFVLVACAPKFPSTGTLTLTPLGASVQLSWPEATESDDGQEIASYRIDVDGTEVVRVPATSRSCVLVGLAPGTTHELGVSAYDTAGEWSGSGTGGTLLATHTAPAGSGTGGPLACVTAVDTDGDRLLDAVETGTGTYVSATDTGSRPDVVDTDADGLTDGDEVLGTVDGLDLAAFGVSPTHKDVLLEYDWFDVGVTAGCGAHSNRPTNAVATRVATAFAAAPVANPDGTTGVNVVQDLGQGGAATGGNLVPDADGVIAGFVNGTEYRAIKAANFDPRRQGSFHYVLMPDRYDTTSSSSGQATINGSDLIVSLGCFGSTSNVANTIVHELGHNLGLRHGGNVETNRKPNYNSVMNYRYQFSGIDTDCNGSGNGVLDYSGGARAQLDENALLETNGVCNGVDIDWNGNRTIDAAPIALDLNEDGSRSVLRDSADWSAIRLSSVDLGARPGTGDPEVVTEQPVPTEFQR